MLTLYTYKDPKYKSVEVGCKQGEEGRQGHAAALRQPFCPTDWSLGGFYISHAYQPMENKHLRDYMNVHVTRARG